MSGPTTDPRVSLRRVADRLDELTRSFPRADVRRKDGTTRSFADRVCLLLANLVDLRDEVAGCLAEARAVAAAPPEPEAPGPAPDARLLLDAYDRLSVAVGDFLDGSGSVDGQANMARLVVSLDRLSTMMWSALPSDALCIPRAGSSHSAGQWRHSRTDLGDLPFREAPGGRVAD